MRKIRKILIVCTGNTARSPVGEYLGNYYAKKYKIDLIFESAGFFNAFSYIQPESKKFLDSKGITHSDFRPKIINYNLLKQQDLILTMELSHKIDIIRNFQRIVGIEKKTFTLKEFNGDLQDIDIIDPYYTSTEIFKKVLRIIDENIEKAITKIIQINNFSEK